MLRRNRVRRKALDGAHDALAVQASGDHDGLRGQRHAMLPADAQLDAIFRDLPALDGGEESDHAAMLFQIALQGQHVGMAIDHAGRGGPERGDAAQVRLARGDFVMGEEFEIVDAVLLRPFLDLLQGCDLVLGGGDDQLAELLVGHAVALDKIVEHFLAAHADIRFQTARRIIDAGMDDFGMTRAGLGADQVMLFQHNHLAPGHGQRPRRC